MLHVREYCKDGAHNNIFDLLKQENKNIYCSVFFFFFCSMLTKIVGQIGEIVPKNVDNLKNKIRPYVKIIFEWSIFQFNVYFFYEDDTGV